MVFDIEKYKESLFQIKDETEFEKLCLFAFEYQILNNPVYKEYCNLLNISLKKVRTLVDIPFIPIELFKSHQISSIESTDFTIFESSGTTGNIPSRHFVYDIDLYKQNFRSIFQTFYGKPQDYSILALLPSYLERTGSSLVFMVDDLIKESKNQYSRFYLTEHEALFQAIDSLENIGQKYILLGVSFALLEFAEKYKTNIKNGIIMETGGMKGRREELTRAQLHDNLKSSFGTDSIHSEYGMTELLSQAYSKGKGIFETPKQMQLLIRDIYDPMNITITGKGAINIIDLANIYSCPFIATSDLGEVFPDGNFSINGRFDKSDVRGCNLMVI